MRREKAARAKSRRPSAGEAWRTWSSLTERPRMDTSRRRPATPQSSHRGDTAASNEPGTSARYIIESNCPFGFDKRIHSLSKLMSLLGRRCRSEQKNKIGLYFRHQPPFRSGFRFDRFATNKEENMAQIPSQKIEEFKSGFQGEVIQPADKGYD